MTHTIPATKSARQALIGRLIENEAFSSQGELASRLEADGIFVTQATLSRDLVELGAVKVRGADGRLVYTTSSHLEAAEDSATRLTRLTAELLHSADGSANIAVLHTPSGAAQYFASAIDMHHDPDVLGTVAGDDTVFVVSRLPHGGPLLAQKFLERAAGATQ